MSSKNFQTFFDCGLSKIKAGTININNIEEKDKPIDAFDPSKRNNPIISAALTMTILSSAGARKTKVVWLKA